MPDTTTTEATLVRPSPGQERSHASFRACMASRFKEMTQEQLNALVSVWHAAVLPSIFFHDETLLAKYIVPLLSQAPLAPTKIVETVRDAASKAHDASVQTLLNRSNLKSSSDHIEPQNGHRVVGALGDYIVVHWLGLPDAYDTYMKRTDLPSTSVASSIDTIQTLTSPSLVVSSDFYNAVSTYAPMWVNPLDFAVPSSVPCDQAQHQPPTKKPRVDPSILKRLQGDAATAVATLLNDAAAAPSVQPTPIPHDDGANLLYGHLSPAPAPPLKATTVLTVDQPSVVVPSCSRWFSLHSIHPIEKRMLPEFFQDNKSKPPTVYMTYRNYMVNASRAAPHVYLTATACRRNLAGDACAILRVHEFLMHWGLINYSVPAHAAPPQVPTLSSFDVEPRSSTASAFPALSSQFVCESCAHAKPVEFELTADAKRKERLLQHGMPLRKLDAWGVRPGSGVCAACFVGRKFPSHLDPSDFTALLPVSTTPWAADEKRRLLDVLDKLDTSQPVDWNDVAQAVGRPAKECVAQFLKTPLDSPTPTTSSRKTKRVAAYPHVTAVPDLASIVASADPSLAKAAAAAAVAQLEQLNQPDQQRVTSTSSDKGQQAAAQALAKTAAAAGMTVVKGEPGATTHEAAAKAQIAAATAAGVLAAKAQGIAKYEDGVVKGLLADLLQCQMQHVQLKLQALDQLETALQAERDQVAKERYEVYVDKLNTAQAKLSASPDE